MFKQVDSSCDQIALEHRILDWWEKSQTFDKLRAKNAGKPPWSFLDGPITANNPMGVHHAWGRTLKDCYQRYHAMLGQELRYQNGFDCQGLWVEVEVEKEMGFATKADIERAGLAEFTNRCKARVEKYSKVQTKQSIRLGYWMDWDNSYYTMSEENNYTIWSFLKKCHQRGLIYKGLDAMPWCPRCETGISEQERREGYQSITDTAVFVQMPLVGRDNEYLLIWTTTPWTLAANVAAAVNPDLNYARVRQNDAVYYLAEGLVPIMKEKGKFEVERTLSGSEMIGWEYEGPFDDLEVVKQTFGAAKYTHRVIAWKDILATEGTGIVHIAPGCGKEDFELGKEQQLPTLMPIGETGNYFDGYGFLAGRSALDVADIVLQRLRETNFYYKKENYEHDYPHCWRCKTKLLFRAVDEWYVNMNWRDEIKEIVKKIRWIPGWGESQELNWLENMGDWMISKKRFWGLALPIYECSCRYFDVIGSREELQQRAVEGWERFEGNTPHRPWVDAVKIKCEKCGKSMSRIPDVGNPWLDAGIVPYSTVHYNTDRDYWQKWIPADLVLECFPGQFRNWFYALLAMSTMMENVPPFKTLLGHALVKDEHGEEMHKSKGNAIWFDEAVEKMGADVMRWLYCSQNPENHLNFGYGVGDLVRRRVFGTWWNVYSFFCNYARLDGFDPAHPAVPYEQLQDIDRWLLSKLQGLIKVAHEALSDYKVESLIYQADDFIERLSNWYVRRNRRRFWRARSDSDTDKLAAYQTLYRVLTDLCRILAPVVPFLTDEMYQNLVRSHDATAPESVHHCDYPQVDPAQYNERLADEMDLVADIVSRVLSIRETKQIRVRQPLQRLLVQPVDESMNNVVKRYEKHILDELNIKELRIEDVSQYQNFSLRPVHKNLGPKFGKDVKTVVALLNQADAKQTAGLVHQGQPVTLDGDGQSFTLAAEDIEVVQEKVENLEFANEPHFTLALDTTITDQLRREGYARDIIRHIQQLRKDTGLEIQDRITVAWHSADETIRSAVDEHNDYIRAETLCDAMTCSETIDGNNAKEIKIGPAPVKLALTKA